MLDPIDPAALAKICLFGQLSPDEHAGLLSYLQPRRYRPGQTIFLQGDPGTGLYLIGAGRVRISVTAPDGRRLVVNRLGPGDFFGELALLDGEPRSADATAQTACELLLLRRDDFLRFVEARPGVAIRLLATVSRRLRNTTQQVQDVAFLDVPTRLTRALLALAETEGRPEGAGLAITRRVTQSELAEMVSATRESVNKWLKHFEGHGLIRRQSGRISLPQPELLRKRLS